MPILKDDDGTWVELGAGRQSRPSQPLLAWDGGGLFGGRPVSHAKVFSTQPWVAIAVMRLLTWSVRVPLKVYRRVDDDGERQRLRPRDHKLAAALKRPWEDGCMADLVMHLLGSLCVHGNSLIVADNGASDTLRFAPLDWRTVLPLRENSADPNGEILGWREHLVGGGTDDHSSQTTMHLRWWSPLGRLGVSPLQQLGSTIRAEDAAIHWSLNTLSQSVRPSGVAEFDDAAMRLPPEDRTALYMKAATDLRGAYAGVENAGKFMVLPPGLKFTSASNTTAVEAELIAQRAVNRNETAAILMIPPPMIGILERANFSNVYTLREVAYTDGLAPPLVLIEQILNAQLVERMLREEDVFVEFDFAGILRGDRLKEIQALREGIGTGLIAPNEGRDVLNLPRSKSERADELFMPSNNLTPIDAAHDLGDLSLAAQRVAQAVEKGLLTKREGRALIGMSGDGPDDRDPEDEESEG